MLAIIATLLPLGCSTSSFLQLISASQRPQSKVWEAFPCAIGHWEGQYGRLFEPCSSHGTEQAGSLKSFEFSGVRLPEQRMAEWLDKVRQDMLRLILDNEGKLARQPQLTLVRGCLEGFEIRYKQARLRGSITGTLKAGTEPGTWDFKCELFEQSAT
jgi:hypothetical protein